ncbi:MAG: RES family NAD+ phosphorylase [Deltaproteobacteria bacterium]|nr:RES family NAD+ phosphorylase [Deltaproteobacteria bacterium]
MKKTIFDDKTFQKLSPESIKGRWYRTVKYKRLKQVGNPLGSSMVEGRYHTTAEDSVLYLSDSPALCMSESTKIFQTVEIKDSAWYTATFKVKLSHVLNLTDPKILKRLSITPADLVQPRPGGYNLTQRIATKARTTGFEAILVQTARPGLSGNNLVVFLEVVANTKGIVAVAS